MSSHMDENQSHLQNEAPDCNTVPHDGAAEASASTSANPFHAQQDINDFFVPDPNPSEFDSQWQQRGSDSGADDAPVRHAPTPPMSDHDDDPPTTTAFYHGEDYFAHAVDAAAPPQQHDDYYNSYYGEADAAQQSGETQVHGGTHRGTEEAEEGEDTYIEPNNYGAAFAQMADDGDDDNGGAEQDNAGNADTNSAWHNQNTHADNHNNNQYHPPLSHVVFGNSSGAFGDADDPSTKEAGFFYVEPSARVAPQPPQPHQPQHPHPSAEIAAAAAAAAAAARNGRAVPDLTDPFLFDKGPAPPSRPEDQVAPDPFQSAEPGPEEYTEVTKKTPMVSAPMAEDSAPQPHRIKRAGRPGEQEDEEAASEPHSAIATHTSNAPLGSDGEGALQEREEEKEEAENTVTGAADVGDPRNGERDAASSASSAHTVPRPSEGEGDAEEEEREVIEEDETAAAPQPNAEAAAAAVLGETAEEAAVQERAAHIAALEERMRARAHVLAVDVRQTEAEGGAGLSAEEISGEDGAASVGSRKTPTSAPDTALPLSTVANETERAPGETQEDRSSGSARPMERAWNTDAASHPPETHDPDTVTVNLHPATQDTEEDEGAAPEGDQEPPQRDAPEPPLLDSGSDDEHHVHAYGNHHSALEENAAAANTEPARQAVHDDFYYGYGEQQEDAQVREQKEDRPAQQAVEDRQPAQTTAAAAATTTTTTLDDLFAPVEHTAPPADVPVTATADEQNPHGEGETVADGETVHLHDASLSDIEQSAPVVNEVEQEEAAPGVAEPVVEEPVEATAPGTPSAEEEKEKEAPARKPSYPPSADWDGKRLSEEAEAYATFNADPLEPRDEPSAEEQQVETDLLAGHDEPTAPATQPGEHLATAEHGEADGEHSAEEEAYLFAAPPARTSTQPPVSEAQGQRGQSPTAEPVVAEEEQADWNEHVEANVVAPEDDESEAREQQEQQQQEQEQAQLERADSVNLEPEADALQAQPEENVAEGHLEEEEEEEEPPAEATATAMHAEPTGVQEEVQHDRSATPVAEVPPPPPQPLPVEQFVPSGEHDYQQGWSQGVPDTEPHQWYAPPQAEQQEDDTPAVVHVAAVNSVPLEGELKSGGEAMYSNYLADGAVAPVPYNVATVNSMHLERHSSAEPVPGAGLQQPLYSDHFADQAAVPVAVGVTAVPSVPLASHEMRPQAAPGDVGVTSHGGGWGTGAPVMEAQASPQAADDIYVNAPPPSRPAAAEATSPPVEQFEVEEADAAVPLYREDDSRRTHRPPQLAAVHHDVPPTQQVVPATTYVPVNDIAPRSSNSNGGDSNYSSLDDKDGIQKDIDEEEKRTFEVNSFVQKMRRQNAAPHTKKLLGSIPEFTEATTDAMAATDNSNVSISDPNDGSFYPRHLSKMMPVYLYFCRNTFVQAFFFLLYLVVTLMSFVRVCGGGGQTCWFTFIVMLFYVLDMALLFAYQQRSRLRIPPFVFRSAEPAVLFLLFLCEMVAWIVWGAVHRRSGAFIVFAFFSFVLWLAHGLTRLEQLVFGLRVLCSADRRRFQTDGFDLDLSYVHHNIIAMAWPADNFEKLFRNDVVQVADFLNRRHPQSYLVINLCSERTYNPTPFHHQTSWYPMDDHNPCELEMMVTFCHECSEFIGEDMYSRVLAIHCKGGKGRTGALICALMLYMGIKRDTKTALHHFARLRTKVGSSKFQGVQAPSQGRYVEYFEELIRLNSNNDVALYGGAANMGSANNKYALRIPHAEVRITRLRVMNLPHLWYSMGIGKLYFVLVTKPNTDRRVHFISNSDVQFSAKVPDPSSYTKKQLRDLFGSDEDNLYNACNALDPNFSDENQGGVGQHGYELDNESFWFYLNNDWSNRLDYDGFHVAMRNHSTGVPPASGNKKAQAVAEMVVSLEYKYPERIPALDGDVVLKFFYARNDPNPLESPVQVWFHTAMEQRKQQGTHFTFGRADIDGPPKDKKFKRYPENFSLDITVE